MFIKDKLGKFISFIAKKCDWIRCYIIINFEHSLFWVFKRLICVCLCNCMVLTKGEYLRLSVLLR